MKKLLCLVEIACSLLICAYQLGKINKCLIIASVYCIATQTAQIGFNTIGTQQIQILLCTSHPNPQPCTQLFKDLIHHIIQWQLTGHKILCLDANKDAAHPHPVKGYGKLHNATGLIDLYCHQHPILPLQPITKEA